MVEKRTRTVFNEPLLDLQKAWQETSHQIQRLRDNPECADSEFALLADDARSALFADLTFNPQDDIAAPFIHSGAKPKIAVLREQGVNGQVEMAAAFTARAFDAYDVHMSDLMAGRAKLADFQMLAACGGSATATYSAQAKAGRKPSCSTPRCASSLPPSLRAKTPSRWACATAAK